MNFAFLRRFTLLVRAKYTLFHLIYLGDISYDVSNVNYSFSEITISFKIFCESFSHEIIDFRIRGNCCT